MAAKRVVWFSSYEIEGAGGEICGDESEDRIGRRDGGRWRDK